MSSLSSARRLLGTGIAVALATAGAAILTAPSALADAPSVCTASFSPTAIHPGETSSLNITIGDDAMTYPAEFVADGHLTPTQTSVDDETIVWSYEDWESFAGGDASSAGFRIYAPGTAMNEVTDSTPALCQAEVSLVAAAPVDQTITFATVSNRLFSANATVALSATADSGLPVTLTVDTPETCELVPGQQEVTELAAGYCEIAANQAGDATHNAAPVAFQGFYLQIGQTITFPAIADQLIGTAPLTLNATSSAGEYSYVEYTSSTPSTCTVDQSFPAASVHPMYQPRASTLELNAVGTCTVTAVAPGGGTYTASPSVTRSFKIKPLAVTPVLSLTAPAGAPLSAKTASIKATSTSGTPSVASATPKVCAATSTTSVKLLKAGTCTVRATEAGATSVTKSFAVWGAPALPKKGKATQVVPVLGVGEDDLKVVAKPTDVCQAQGDSVLLVAPGTCKVTVKDGADKVRSGSVDVVFPKAAKTPQQLTHGGTAYFSFNSAVLTAKAKKALHKHLATLKDAKLVVVYGNTYGPGENSAHSRKLAGERAQAVIDYLAAHGVKAKAVSVAAAMENPVSKNPAKNRRADIYYVKQDASA